MLPAGTDENPYRSPTAGAADAADVAIDEPSDSDHLKAARGKRAILVIIYILLGVNAVLFLLQLTTGVGDLRFFPMAVGFVVIIAQCVFVYRGLRWARIWLLLSLAFTSMMCALVAISGFAGGDLNGAAYMAAFALLYGGIAVRLLFSDSIREFLDAQLNRTDEVQ